MFGIGLVEVVVVVVVLAVGAVLLGRALSQPPGASAVVREQRLVRLTRLGGAVVGVVAAGVVSQAGRYGAGTALAPAVLGLVVLLATALGERVVRSRPAPGPRSASLARRRVVDHLPRVLTAAVATALLVMVATMVLTTVTADRDPGTDTMRALSCSTAVGGQGRTPYPGSYYTVPLAVVLVAVLVVAALAATACVRRPRGVTGSDAGDDALRRRSVTVIVAATGLAVSAPLVGVALVAGLALQVTGDEAGCAPGWWQPVGLALTLVAVPALALAAACVAVLVADRPVVVAARDGALR